MSLVSVLKRIPNDAKRLEAQNKREWMLSNPLSLQIIDDIYKKQRVKKDAPQPDIDTLTTTRRRHIVNEKIAKKQRLKKKNSRYHMRMSLSATERWKSDKHGIDEDGKESVEAKR